MKDDTEESSTKLTARQVPTCENAKSPKRRCRCRCRGEFHGANRGKVRDLPETDPHHPDDESPKERKARLAKERYDKLLRSVRG